MLSPMMTVAVLVVLWLIVVVPMIVRRKDRRLRDRSMSRFGAAMSALGSRRVVSGTSTEATVDVPGARALPVSTRPPAPAARESLMYEPDRHELSEARRQMMARRRRSLTVLIGGSILFLATALLDSATLWWLLAVAFAVGLGGYVAFLRGQAKRDRERRETRRMRARLRPTRDYDATAEPPVARPRPAAVVSIDDDDVALAHLDTVDLTGLYREDEEYAPIRRAG